MESRSIKGVLFDAFGTLCRIEAHQFPYRLILKRWAKGAADCYHALMTQDVPIADFAQAVGLSREETAVLEMKAAEEIASMCLFPEIEATLQKLREHGVKIAVVSNLANPYGKPTLELLPFAPDAWAFSYEVGARKPEEAIYRHAWERLGCAPTELLMIGDSLQNDYQTPVELGLQALWLDRSQAGSREEGVNMVDSVAAVLKRLGID